jgi:hypothetical protein
MRTRTALESQASQQPFVCGAEVWRIDASARALSLESAAYAGPLEGSLPLGEKLAARVGLSGLPLAVSFHPSKDGTTAATGTHGVLAWPLRNPACVLVLVGVGERAALEVWGSEREQSRLTLWSGYHGELDDFRRVTVGTRFSPGEGLPGRTVAEQRPVLLPRLDDTDQFLRVTAAVASGLAHAAGWPVSANAHSAVVALLGSMEQGLARAIAFVSSEGNPPLVWVRDDSPRDIELATSTARSALERHTPQAALHPAELDPAAGDAGASESPGSGVSRLSLSFPIEAESSARWAGAVVA